jgi:excisionase family DNA binding protein
MRIASFIRSLYKNWENSPVTVKEFAERTEISLSLAYMLIAEGRVPHRRIGQRGKRGAIRIAEEDFKEFMEAVKALEVQ